MTSPTDQHHWRPKPEQKLNQIKEIDILGNQTWRVKVNIDFGGKNVRKNP